MLALSNGSAIIHTRKVTTASPWTIKWRLPVERRIEVAKTVDWYLHRPG